MGRWAKQLGERAARTQGVMGKRQFEIFSRGFCRSCSWLTPLIAAPCKNFKIARGQYCRLCRILLRQFLMVFCGFKEIEKNKLGDPRLIYLIYHLFTSLTSKKQFGSAFTGHPSCEVGSHLGRHPKRYINRTNCRVPWLL